MFRSSLKDEGLPASSVKEHSEAFTAFLHLGDAPQGRGCQALPLSPSREKPSNPSARVSLPPGLVGLSAQLPRFSLQCISLHPVLDMVCLRFPLSEFGPGVPVASALKWEDFYPSSETFLGLCKKARRCLNKQGPVGPEKARSLCCTSVSLPAQ